MYDPDVSLKLEYNLGCSTRGNTGWAKKTGLFFRLDNFVMVSPRKACSMSKFSLFYREKGTKLAFQ